MKSMTQLKYHFGGKLSVSFDNEQRQIVKINSDITRAVYNKQVFYDHYIGDLKSVYGLSRFNNDPMIVDWIQSVNKHKRLFTNMKCLTAMSFLKDNRVDSLAANAAYLNHKKAWTNHNKHPEKFGFPTFHRAKDDIYAYKYQTSCLYHKNKDGQFVGSVRLIDSQHIKLPKLGIVKVNYIPTKLFNHWSNLRIGTVTIQIDVAGNEFVSLQVASDQMFVSTFSKTDSSVGIDMNTGDITVDSGGHKIKNPKFYHNAKLKLARIDKHLSYLKRQYKKLHSTDKKSLKNCKHYQQLRLKRAKLFKHILNQRQNYLHLISKSYVENQDLICIENLQVKHMSRTHAHNHNRLIRDVGWNILANDLAYKCELYGKRLIIVSPAYTTQRCHVCGHIKRDADKLTVHGNQKHHTGHDEYICYNSNCSVYMQVQDRDINAAQNILARGQAQLID